MCAKAADKPPTAVVREEKVKKLITIYYIYKPALTGKPGVKIDKTMQPRNKLNLYPLIIILALCLLPLFSQAQKKSKMAADGFNAAGSDAKAIALADKVIQNMGGYDAWNNTRYIAWTWRNQYHIWDKFQNRYRLERGDTLVVIADLNTKEGVAYSNGKEIKDPDRRNKLITGMYPSWANDSYWLALPFKLKDSGVTLKYKGEGKTQTGTDADLIELTFKGVGVTPDNRYILAIDKTSGLITEWSFFRNYADEKPTFTRPWTDYHQYGKIKLASSRGDAPMGMNNIAVTQKIPDEVFNSPTPVNKALIK